jgi:SAM-dependent methyltransferase
MNLLDHVHREYVFPRRVLRLCDLLSQLIPAGCSVLDVGCGDGKLASSLLQKRPDLRVQGVDVLARERTWIPITRFDGTQLPYGSDSFDAVMFVDVLHHARDPLVLLREALRVSRRWIILKDHVLQGFAAGLRLRFMDYVGNAGYGVALPYNYWTAEKWSDVQQQLGLKISAEIRRLKLYLWPADYVFGAGLHFIALYEVPE